MAFRLLLGLAEGPVEFGGVLSTAVVVVCGRREGPPAPAEDPESCKAVLEVGVVVVAVSWNAQDGQAWTIRLWKLRLGSLGIKKICRSVAEPHFFKSASVGCMGGPSPGLAPGFCNVGYQDFSGFIQLPAGSENKKFKTVSDVGHRCGSLNRQIQLVIVIEDVVVSHDAVEGRISQFSGDVLNPACAVFGVPDVHLPVARVSVPLDAGTVQSGGEPSPTRVLGLLIGDT